MCLSASSISMYILTSSRRVIKENVEGQDAIDLQHLRRFAKPKYLPPHVLGQRDLIKEMYSVPRAWESTLPSVLQDSSSTAWEWSTSSKARNSGKAPTLYLLVCPTKVIQLQDLHDLMMKHNPFASDAGSWAYPLQIKEITVPLLAPTSPEKADEWSELYWPTFYRKTNPFGAHPASIYMAENQLEVPADGNLSIAQAMDLATQAGDSTKHWSNDLSFGCVVLERVEDKTDILAVAGDARHKPLPSEKKRIKSGQTGCSEQGNVMGHAVMRAVGMIGRKRLRCASTPISKAAAKAESNFAAVGLEHDEAARDAFFLDLPLNELERQYFDRDNIKPDGYLCLKLELFLTHEPCIMCSMALVHSRVGRVIFMHRMPKTGGLTSEMVRNDTGPVGLGYGLCWRKELNWQFSCWEYTDRQLYSYEGQLSLPDGQTRTNAILAAEHKKLDRGKSAAQEDRQRHRADRAKAKEGAQVVKVAEVKFASANKFTALFNTSPDSDSDSDADDDDYEDDDDYANGDYELSSFASIHV